MGTPCAIGLKMEDGTVNAIRCNWDGCVAGVGATLAGWYKEPERIKELLALGDISALGRELAPVAGVPHTFENQQPDVTIPYHRDRHEPMCSAKRFASVDEYQRTGKGEMGADYLYLFDAGAWRIFGLYHEEGWVNIQVKLGNSEK